MRTVLAYIPKSEHAGILSGQTTYDCTADIQAAIADRIAKKQRVLMFPAGTYLCATAGAFDLGAAVVNGFAFVGEGMGVTTVRFINSDGTTPPSENYLYSNTNHHLRVRFQGIRFEGDPVNKNSRFMYLTSAGNAQSIRFFDCMWYQFEGTAVLEGTANASEMVFAYCKWSNIYGKMYRVNNVQSVLHTFIACDIEVCFDDIFYFGAGGMLNVFGGSLIMGTNGATTGAVLHLDDTSGVGIGFGNWTYNFYGVRTELKDDSKFLDGQGQGHVNLTNCNTYVLTGTSGRIIYTLYHGLMMTVSGGYFNGKVYLQAANASAYASDNRPATVIIRDSLLGSQFAWERQAVTNVGGMGKLIIEHCKPFDQPAGASEPMDQCVGWDEGSNGFAIQQRVAILHDSGRTGGLPRPSMAPTVTLKLPLNAIITSIRLYHPAEAGSAGQVYTLKNGDASVTHKTWTFDASSTQNAPDAMYYRCDSDTNRTLVFEGDAANADTSYVGHLEVTYLA